MSEFNHSTRKGSLTNERARAQAEEKGCYVELADDHTLQIDIDSDADFELFKTQAKRLSETSTVMPATYSVLRSSGGKRHVIIRLEEPRDVVERIMLQACLGSDRIREILNYARYLSQDEEPVLLFRPKEELDPVVGNREEEEHYVRDIVDWSDGSDAQG